MISCVLREAFAPGDVTGRHVPSPDGVVREIPRQRHRREGPPRGVRAAVAHRVDGMVAGVGQLALDGVRGEPGLVPWRRLVVPPIREDPAPVGQVHLNLQRCQYTS